MFSKVYLFDNTPGGIPQEKSAEFRRLGCAYAGTGENHGIAFALNRVMETAARDGYEWVVAFDQDFSFAPNMAEEYTKHTADEKNGILCPVLWDKRRGYRKFHGKEGTSELNYAVTSGSCTRVSAWEHAGKYDEDLFIDLVDHDFSKRVRYAGYRLLRVDSVLMGHESGIVEPRKVGGKLIGSLADLFRSPLLGRLCYRKTVVPMRVYYTNRNMLYLNKRHKRYGGIGYESYDCRGYLSFFLLFNFASFLRGREKARILKAILSGVKDGRRMAKAAGSYEIPSAFDGR
ncbi:MAG: hypothetical protein LBQ15_08300 [Clostridium sp.]|nr:hypothetical protein [Clostridium sp.]